MKSIKLGKNIYPNVEDFSEIREKLVKRFGINLYFLFEDGIEFQYPDYYKTSKFPGDVSFYKDDRLVLYCEESFTTINFYLPNDILYFDIPIENMLKTDFLVEALQHKVIVSSEEEISEDEEDIF